MFIFAYLYKIGNIINIDGNMTYIHLIGLIKTNFENTKKNNDFR